MKIGIVGLGLIGGSFAKAYKSAGSHAVYGCDTDGRILDFALLDGACLLYTSFFPPPKERRQAS